MTKDEALRLAQRALSNKNASTKRIYEALAAIQEALAQPAPPPPECKTEAEQTAYAFGWWKALESVRTEPDWKDLFEKQKRRAEMWIAKYEKDIGPLEKAAPVAQPTQEPVACVQDLDEVKRKHLVYQKGMDWKDPLYTTQQQPEQEPLLALFDENQRLRAELKFNTVQQQEPRNFCPRCGKRTADLSVIHTCTPPRGLEMT